MQPLSWQEGERYMRRKNVVIVLGLIAVLIAVVSIWSMLSAEPPQAAEDEIMLKIQLDLKEDIGLLILDCKMNGVETSGGISNVNKTMLKHDEVLYWTLNKREYDHPADTGELTIRFRVITEYCDPNYENIYPEEYVILLDPISINVGFGENYATTITGDKANGYQAVFEEP